MTTTIDFDALRAAAEKHDEFNGLSVGWEPKHVDERDPRMVTAVADAVEAFEKTRSLSAGKRLDTLAEKLGVERAAAEEPIEAGRTIPLGLSEFGARVVRQAVENVIQFENVEGIADKMQGSDELSDDEYGALCERIVALCASLKTELDGHLR